jgi:hypothetical protein
VIKHLHKDKILANMGGTDLTHKDPDWIREYQFSVNKVIQSLGENDEVLKKYGDMVKLWNGTELPDDLKRK